MRTYHYEIIQIPGVDDDKSTREPIPSLKGFEVQSPTFQLSPITPVSPEWKLAEFAAQYAVEFHCAVTRLEYKQLVKATIELVAGVIYYVTFTALDLHDQKEKVYRAKVWAKVTIDLECLYFEELTCCQVSGGEIRGKIAAIISSLPSELLETRRDTDVSYDVHPDIDIEPTNKEIMINGFCFLMKEIKAQNPSWKHSKVRKVASKKWRSTTRLGKWPYILKARKQFFQKRSLERGNCGGFGLQKWGLSPGSDLEG